MLADYAKSCSTNAIRPVEGSGQRLNCPDFLALSSKYNSKLERLFCDKAISELRPQVQAVDVLIPIGCKILISILMLNMNHMHFFGDSERCLERSS